MKPHEPKPETAAIQALESVLNAHPFLAELKAANVLGMGGAGAPAYGKWLDVWLQSGPEKYVVANGDESEPGTFKDREILLHKPHLVVEGIAIRYTEQEMLAGKGDNVGSPAALVALLAKIGRNQTGLSSKSAQRLYKLLLAVRTGPNRLKAGVPGAVVAHKTGTSQTTSGVTDATNDVGLIEKGRSRIAVAVFVRASPADEATRERVIAELARAAFTTLRPASAR